MKEMKLCAYIMHKNLQETSIWVGELPYNKYQDLEGPQEEKALKCIHKRTCHFL